MSIAQLISFYANGYNLAPYLQYFTPEAEAESIDASVLANDYKSKERGFISATIQASGVFDHDSTDLDTLSDVMAAAFADGSEAVVTTSFGTVAVGGVALLMNAITVKYSIKSALGQLILNDVNLDSNSGINPGVWLANTQLNSGTTNGTAVDNGAATSNGGLFHVHLHNDDASDCDFKVQHSVDNSVWADLVSINNLSAANDYGSAVVAAGTTVRRYIRLVSTITGGDTFLVSAAFARR